MLEKLEIIKQKYLNLQKKILSDTKNLNNIELLKQINELKKIVSVYDEYLNLIKEKENLKKLITQNNLQNSQNENEFVLLFQEEKKILDTQIQEKLDKLQKKLFTKDEDKNKNVLMEIKAAAGGSESNLFVADLFRAYIKYAESKKWKIDIINLVSGVKSGIFAVEMMIYGDDVYSFLQYESGIHRVQRVPETEKRGRVHTSTVKILVSSVLEETKIDLNWNDIRVDTFNSSGPGGQSVNTTKSAVRLTYIPTGDSVACQIAKSQHQNKEKAFQLLKNKVYNKIISEKQKQQNEIKKNLISKGDRSSKIRTYNYAQNRITDHRINLTLQKLDFFMEGRIDLIIEPLKEEFNKQNLKEQIKI
ncbi:peptide chain release factor 1 [Columbia Basin potato purple top phytoplasma]|uniref:PCRF domain-containing protein n=1 Tax=Columbia Basin potato purple top phytoplasma TaxID=307134 RepID=A0ABT5L900_9MOLU|nr:PCRF domain-containing protein [Columbia Basin potato purple top phytoplasma]MDC9031791.1 PCRF domain-containing protein [Columbia Basin potato purple top phytoplasma]